MSEVTVTFEPNSSESAYYTVYGIPSSGNRVPIASGYASGTTSLPVSGYENYSFTVDAKALISEEMLNTDATVTLAFGSQKDFQTILWSIFQYIGVIWGNTAQSGMEEFQFNRVIDWQVAIDPNYATYYAATVAEYTRLLQSSGSVDVAIRTLFSENQAPNPKVANVEQYVLKEFLIWQIAYGGFSAFGPPYENYTGWMGGGNFNDVPTPYRAIANE